MNSLLPELNIDGVHRVRIYVDEIKGFRNSEHQQWMYMGVLIIPEHHIQTVLEELNADRISTNYFRELHFTKLRNKSCAYDHGEKTATARHWIKRVIGDDRKIYHFHLFGLNLSNLQKSAFGENQRQQRFNIYNRFFRSSLIYALKYFFDGRPVVVTRLCHDITEFQDNGTFEWHAIWRINSSRDQIQFAEDAITFVDSDHTKESLFPQESHFIQLCDLLLGSMTQVLDNRNNKDGCNEIAQLIYPLMERLTNRNQYRNPRSRYHYYQRLYVSFFPSRRLTPKQVNDLAWRARSEYYIERRLLWQESNVGQLQLSLGI